jgi:hypothetical protein
MFFALVSWRCRGVISRFRPQMRVPGALRGYMYKGMRVNLTQGL